MKKIVLFFFISLLFTSVKAQIKFEPGIQANGPMDEYFSAGAGFDISVKYMITKNIGVGLAIGYQHLFLVSDWDEQWFEEWGYNYYDANENIMPIRASLTYYFGNGKLRPYLGLEAGVTKFYEHYSYDDSSYGELTNDYTESYFAYAPQLGFELGMGQLLGLDLNVKYNAGDLSYLSAKLGLVFNIGSKK